MGSRRFFSCDIDHDVVTRLSADAFSDVINRGISVAIMLDAAIEF